MADCVCRAVCGRERDEVYLKQKGEFGLIILSGQFIK